MHCCVFQYNQCCLGERGTAEIGSYKNIFQVFVRSKLRVNLAKLAKCCRCFDQGCSLLDLTGASVWVSNQWPWLCFKADNSRSVSFRLLCSGASQRYNCIVLWRSYKLFTVLAAQTLCTVVTSFHVLPQCTYLTSTLTFWFTCINFHYFRFDRTGLGAVDSMTFFETLGISPFYGTKNKLCFRELQHPWLRCHPKYHW